MKTPAPVPNRTTLERTPPRVLAFLIGVGRKPAVRGALEARGYSDEEHQRGWTLLRAIDPIGAPAATPKAPESDPKMRAALALIDAWDNDNFPVANVALRKRAPEAHAWIFADDLAPAEGPASVRVVATFLDRLDALDERAAKRGKTPADVNAAQARAALVLLDSRGITADARATVRSWINTVQTGAPPATVTPTPAAEDETPAAASPLADLHDWLDEWSTVARRVLKRRGDLIDVGLAARKAPKRKTKTGAEPEPAKG